MIKFIMSFFLLTGSLLLQASFDIQVIEDEKSEKLINRKTDFVEYWKVLKFGDYDEKQKEEFLGMRWKKYLEDPHFVLAEKDGEAVAFLFYIPTVRKAPNKEEKNWAFLSGYAICPGKEQHEKEVIPLLLDKICEHAKTPRILTATAKTNDKMIKTISEYEFEDETFVEGEVMEPNWLATHPLEKHLYYKMKR